MLYRTQKIQSSCNEALDELTDSEARMIYGGQSFTPTVPQVKALSLKETIPTAIITDNIIG